jgi:DNA-binding NarL/FixJ family response regulator
LEELVIRRSRQVVYGPRAAEAATVIVGSANAERIFMDGPQVDDDAAGMVGYAEGPQGGSGRRRVPDRFLRTMQYQATGREAAPLSGYDSVTRHEIAKGPGILDDKDILIVDDCTLYRDYLAGILGTYGVDNLCLAWDLPSLLAGIETTRPSVMLLNMATRDSTMLLRQALKLTPGVRVIALGMSEDDESEIVACAEVGVAGYHLRSESLEDLLVLLRKVAGGESSCSPRVSAILLRRFRDLASTRRQTVDKQLVLTVREDQVLEMLELGLSNQEIADDLCIAVNTVKNHVHGLLKKLGVNTRAQAAAHSRAVRHHPIHPRN